MFGIYLMLNGTERFIIELIRVNKLYPVLGFKLSQAEIIAVMLVVIGLILVLVAGKVNKTAKES